MHWLEKWLLPPRCVLSGERTEEIDVSDILVQGWRRPVDVCPQCCEPSPEGRVCGACLTAPPAFDRTQVGFYFHHELVDLLYGLKYQNQIVYSRILGTLLAERVHSGEVEALLAVPLYPGRRRQRGYNQAELIAARVARELNLPLMRGTVLRVKDTPSQTHLNAHERRQNLKRAFEGVAESLEGVNRVALVDDVITTGATMQQLSEVLKREFDLEYIEAWAVAKTK